MCVCVCVCLLAVVMFTARHVVWVPQYVLTREQRDSRSLPDQSMAVILLTTMNNEEDSLTLEWPLW